MPMKWFKGFSADNVILLVSITRWLLLLKFQLTTATVFKESANFEQPAGGLKVISNQDHGSR